MRQGLFDPLPHCVEQSLYFSNGVIMKWYIFLSPEWGTSVALRRNVRGEDQRSWYNEGKCYQATRLARLLREMHRGVVANGIGSLSRARLPGVTAQLCAITTHVISFHLSVTQFSHQVVMVAH